MTEEQKKQLERFISNTKLVTYRVLDWNKVMTKGEICDILEVSRPTLDRKLKFHKWNLNEIKCIIKNMPF